MNRLCGILIILFLAALAGGCSKPSENEAAIEKRLTEKGTVDLMDEVAKAPDYPPPADGRLTEKQVEMYLDVRQREQKIRAVALKSLEEKGGQAEKEKRKVGLYEAMKAVGDVADMATADLRAAMELGHNPKEFQWVKDRVLEVQFLDATSAANQQISQSRDRLLAMLEKQRDAMLDPAQKAEIQRQIDQFEKNAPDGETNQDPTKLFNARLIDRYKDDFAKLKAEDQRLSREGGRSGSAGGGV